MRHADLIFVDGVSRYMIHMRGGNGKTVLVILDLKLKRSDLSYVALY